MNKINKNKSTRSCGLFSLIYVVNWYYKSQDIGKRQIQKNTTPSQTCIAENTTWENIMVELNFISLLCITFVSHTHTNEHIEKF